MHVNTCAWPALLLLQMYTYYLRPVLVGHEATLTAAGAAEEALRYGGGGGGGSVRGDMSLLLGGWCCRLGPGLQARYCPNPAGLMCNTQAGISSLPGCCH